MVVYCPICGKAIKTLYGLIYHVRLCHADVLRIGDDAGYLCPICGSRFEKEATLRRHAMEMVSKGDAMHALLLLAMFDKKSKSARTRSIRKKAFELMKVLASRRATHISR